MRTALRAGLVALAVVGSAIVVLVLTIANGDAGSGSAAGSRSGAGAGAAPRADAGAGAGAGSVRVMTLGYSVEHRPIEVIVRGDPHAPHPTLVVGAIHGNETAGIAVTRRLVAGPAPPGSALWIIPDLNPDGVAAGTRQNAHGVDLNRNSPYRWRALYARGDPQYGGPRPLSEPESRLVHALILRLAPGTAIWFHQPLGVTDRSGGNVRVERRFAALSGLPLRELTRYPGSVTSWENHRFPSGTAFVVELPAGRSSAPAVARFAAAVLRLAGEAAPPQ